MINMIKRVSSTLFKALEVNARARVRRELLQRDERTLADMGFSRYLLEKGVDAWPWREDEMAHLGTGSFTEKDYRKAAKELQAYTDNELADLDLRRGDINHAVRHGRPGIDNADQKAA